MAEFQLKNIYSEAFFETFTNDFKSVYSDFDKVQFLKLLLDSEWENRALKQRVRHITHCLGEILPNDYRTALAIMKKVGATLEGKFEYMFFPDFVEVYGLEDFEASSEALRLFTPICSSEFAVRPFIVKYYDKMMPLLMEWTQSNNHHVRRLASEGSRSRLPWGMALKAFKKNPKPILPILEALKDDESEYVRRSVANNLNDISKDAPELVLHIANQWIGANENRDKLLKHALRTLLKKGNTEAMQLFGFANPASVEIFDLKIKPTEIEIGTNGFFSFSLKHTEGKTTKLRIEYAIYYVKSNGSRSRKIFQLTEKTFESNKIYTFERKQHFKNLTTRKHYAGLHELVLVVNGVDKERIEFELTSDKSLISVANE